MDQTAYRVQSKADWRVWQALLWAGWFCLRMKEYMYIYIYTHTYIHTYIHAYIHTYMHACMHTYIHTYIHMYIYIYISLSLSLCVCLYMIVYVYFAQSSTARSHDCTFINFSAFRLRWGVCPFGLARGVMMHDWCIGMHIDQANHVHTNVAMMR